jgi:hypothetical protein
MRSTRANAPRADDRLHAEKQQLERDLSEAGKSRTFKLSNANGGAPGREISVAKCDLLRMAPPMTRRGGFTAARSERLVSAYKLLATAHQEV